MLFLFRAGAQVTGCRLPGRRCRPARPKFFIIYIYIYIYIYIFFFCRFLACSSVSFQFLRFRHFSSKNFITLLRKGLSVVFYEFVLAQENCMLQNYSKNSKPTTENENCTHQHLHGWFGKHKKLGDRLARFRAPAKKKMRNRFIFRASVFFDRHLIERASSPQR